MSLQKRLACVHGMSSSSVLLNRLLLVEKGLVGGGVNREISTLISICILVLSKEGVCKLLNYLIQGAVQLALLSSQFQIPCSEPQTYQLISKKS